jgi:hypothetical protein
MALAEMKAVNQAWDATRRQIYAEYLATLQADNPLAAITILRCRQEAAHKAMITVRSELDAKRTKNAKDDNDVDHR